MATAGRKRKVGPGEKLQIVAIVKSGGSLADAAGIIECTAQTVRNAMKADPDFLRGVRKAQKTGKMRLIRRVGKAKAWQAAAWMLERKYGAEYGRKDSHQTTVRKVVKHEHRHTIDYDQIAKDLEHFAGGRIPSDRNGKPVHSDSAHPLAKALPGLAG